MLLAGTQLSLEGFPSLCMCSDKGLAETLQVKLARTAISNCFVNKRVDFASYKLLLVKASDMHTHTHIPRWIDDGQNNLESENTILKNCNCIMQCLRQAIERSPYFHGTVTSPGNYLLNAIVSIVHIYWVPHLLSPSERLPNYRAW